jgi:hypothetical protein
LDYVKMSGELNPAAGPLKNGQETNYVWR